MAKQEIAFTDYFDLFCEKLGSGGCLLASLNEEGVPNAMTIGWALLGVVWRRPICAVLVRPSRYTYGCIEATGDFTVNVPPAELSDEVLFCGTESGRDHDKFRECGFTATESAQVKSPRIGECLIAHECAVVQKNDVEPGLFVDDIISTFYAGGDFHRVYYGQIMASYADVERLEQV
ncbi:MAG: flavin reductase family protein [Armatimonadota bacterium]|nr:flavin reductase family protein [Armatimonadota bacterium]